MGSTGMGSTSQGTGSTGTGTGSTGVAPPNVGSVSATTTIGSPITIDLLANSSDPQGYALTVDAVGTANLGTVVQVGPGTIEYTPTAVGSDTISFSVNDGHGNEVGGTTTVQVDDTAPTAGPISVSTSGGSSILIDLLSNCSDPGGSTLSFQSCSQGTIGTVSLIQGSLVEYSPPGYATGTDSFSYSVINTQGDVGYGIVFITFA
jgi:hypothetical protein